MTDTSVAQGAEARADRQVRRLTKSIERFARAHAAGGEGVTDAIVEYVSGIGTRVVLVGADGTWGDQVAANPAAARAAVEAAAGVTLHEEFPNDVALRMKTGDYEWKRMAGIQL